MLRIWALSGEQSQGLSVGLPVRAGEGVVLRVEGGPRASGVSEKQKFVHRIYNF